MIRQATVDLAQRLQSEAGSSSQEARYMLSELLRTFTFCQADDCSRRFWKWEEHIIAADGCASDNAGLDSDLCSTM